MIKLILKQTAESVAVRGFTGGYRLAILAKSMSDFIITGEVRRRITITLLCALAGLALATPFIEIVDFWDAFPSGQDLELSLACLFVGFGILLTLSGLAAFLQCLLHRILTALRISFFRPAPSRATAVDASPPILDADLSSVLLRI